MAGVSTATVSRVINQTAWVEPVTRERVEKAMRDLNYRRNAAAIALAKRSGDMLGLLTGNLADPFFAHLARGVEDVSRKQQYRLMVCSGGHDEEMEKAGLDFLVNQGCEAIVVHASRLPDKELLRYAAHFPALVVVNRYIAGMANRCIWLENRSAAREATRYLLANGHRRIACVTSDLPIIDRQERLDGYREALEEYGISPDPRWVISVPFNKERPAQHQQAFKTDTISKRAHRQHHASHDQRININDPQQLVAVGPQCHTQCRRGDMQDRGINGDRNIDQHNND